jgi:hypothetical protein
MQQHFNIGQKVEVNPFENVKYVRMAAVNHSTELLHKLLNAKSAKVETRKINDIFHILYNVELLDFTTLLSWLAPYRGKFQMVGKRNHSYIPIHNIHFLIEDDIMTCW